MFMIEQVTGLQFVKEMKHSRHSLRLDQPSADTGGPSSIPSSSAQATPSSTVSKESSSGALTFFKRLFSTCVSMKKTGRKNRKSIKENTRRLKSIQDKLGMDPSPPGSEIEESEDDQPEEDYQFPADFDPYFFGPGAGSSV